MIEYFAQKKTFFSFLLKFKIQGPQPKLEKHNFRKIEIFPKNPDFFRLVEFSKAWSTCKFSRLVDKKCIVTQTTSENYYSDIILSKNIFFVKIMNIEIIALSAVLG